MKILLAISLLATCFLAHSRSHKDYLVISRGKIFAECSDFLGKTLAGGDIYLRDFLISSEDSSDCSLQSNGSVTIIRSSIEAKGGYHCISGKSLKFLNTGYKGLTTKQQDVEKIFAEVVNGSVRARNFQQNSRVKVVNASLPELVKKGVITIQSEMPTIINVSGKDIHISKLGLRIPKNFNPRYLLWNFYEAEQLTLNNSGIPKELSPLGFPGTVLAPHAKVTINNILISGGLYAEEILGAADEESCVGKVSGQIERHCVSIPGLPFGCPHRSPKDPAQVEAK